MRVIVLSDTHIRPGGKTRLPPRAYAALTGADAILHCGDVVAAELLDELASFAPVHAVLGNNDVELRGRLPGERVTELGGVRVGMVHDAGPKKGRAARLRRRFPTCDLVVFGHSHIPVDEPGLDGQWLVNPGSPTQRRRQPHHTLAAFDVRDGRVVDHEILIVGPDEPT